MSEALFGYTIGKFIFHINVVDRKGNKISFFNSIVRNLPKLIPLLLLLKDFKISDDQGYFSFLDIILINVFPIIISIQALTFISYMLGSVFLNHIPLHDYLSKSHIIVNTTKISKVTKNISSLFGLSFILIQILFVIAIPSFIHAETRAKISSIKSNMHILQNMIETYSINHNGLYPSSISDLKSDAKKENYWQELKSPCDNSIEKIIEFSSDILIKDIEFKKVIRKCNLGYFINSSKTKYKIYGATLIDNKLIKYNDNLFYLSNE